MSDDTFKLRVIVAQDPDNRQWPVIVAGVSDDTWEVMPPEDWDEAKRKLAEEWLGPDWTIYDFAEAVLCVPADKLRALFSPPIEISQVETA